MAEPHISSAGHHLAVETWWKTHPKDKANLRWRLRCRPCWLLTIRTGGAWRSTKQAFNAEILIKSRPMNAKASPGDFPVITILLRSMQQSGIPSQGGGIVLAPSRSTTRTSTVELPCIPNAPGLTMKLLPCFYQHSPVVTPKPLDISKLGRPKRR